MIKTRNQTYVLILLCLLFAAPGVAAYLFYNHPQWLGQTTTNKGVLLNPPELLSIIGENNKWHLALWSPNLTESQTLEQLDRLAKIRLALGRRLYNVDICWLTDEKAAFSDMTKHMIHDHDIRLLQLPQTVLKHLTTIYPQSNIFIINPMQYMVLKYTVSAQSKDIFHDIQQLMKG